MEDYQHPTTPVHLDRMQHVDMNQIDLEAMSAHITFVFRNALNNPAPAPPTPPATTICGHIRQIRRRANRTLNRSTEQITRVGQRVLVALRLRPPPNNTHVDYRNLFANFDLASFMNNLPNWNKLSVEISEVPENPVKFLLDMHQPLKNGEKISVVYTAEGKKSDGFDAGGLWRDFLSKVLENLFNESSDENKAQNFLKKESGLPHFSGKSENKENEKQCFETLGKLLSEIAQGSYGFNTGPIFGEKFYEILSNYLNTNVENQEEWLISSYLNIIAETATPGVQELCSSASLDKIDSDLLDQETLEFVQVQLDDYSLTLDQLKTDDEIRGKIKASILDDAQQNRKLEAIAIIGQEMKNDLAAKGDEEIAKLKPGQLQDLIEGSVSAEAILTKIKWSKLDSVSAEAAEKHVDYLENWIRTASKEQLGSFLKAVTSSRAVGQGEITVSLHNLDSLPSSHTCIKKLDLPTNSKDQDNFNERLELFINESLAGTGFQFL